MNKFTEKAFDYHAEMTKQLFAITLGVLAAVIAVTRIAPDVIGNEFATYVAVVMFLASLASGILHLGSLVHAVQILDPDNPNFGSNHGVAPLKTKPVLFTARAQQLTFLVGLVAVALAAGF